MDGRVLSEILDPSSIPPAEESDVAPTLDDSQPVQVPYSNEEAAAIKRRLTDLGYM
jgi:hypothetical protein